VGGENNDQQKSFFRLTVRASLIFVKRFTVLFSEFNSLFLHARLWESATAEHLSLLTLPDSDSGCRILFFVVGNFPFILSKLM
jgi:hypothetical protein